MGVDHRRQAAMVFRRQPREPRRFHQNPLQHQGIHIDKAILQKMQSKSLFVVTPSRPLLA